jgi:putative FmdB family regulatory protein
MAIKVNDYTCNDCGSSSELWIADNEPPVCPKCQSTNMAKMVAATNISSSGGRDLRSRTPESFRELSRAIKKGVPDKYRGTQLNIT